MLWAAEQGVQKRFTNHWRITLPSALRQQGGSHISGPAAGQSANGSRLHGRRLEGIQRLEQNFFASRKLKAREQINGGLPDRQRGCPVGVKRACFTFQSDNSLVER